MLTVVFAETPKVSPVYKCWVSVNCVHQHSGAHSGHSSPGGSLCDMQEGTGVQSTEQIREVAWEQPSFSERRWASQALVTETGGRCLIQDL